MEFRWWSVRRASAVRVVLEAELEPGVAGVVADADRAAEEAAEAAVDSGGEGRVQ